jgi:SAM-dependent methyltransferase
MTMASADRDEIRAAVAARYAGLARAVQAGQEISDGDQDAGPDSACGAPAYPNTDGLPEAAVRASLGCGNPVVVADLRPGETVLDLGSGGGIDVLLSARRVGPDGKAYGLDMTTEMLDLARASARAAGAQNAEFLQGQIEAIPLPGGSVDVIISNCVINLSTDRPAVFAESFRYCGPAAAWASQTSSPRTTSPRPSGSSAALRPAASRGHPRSPSTGTGWPGPGSPASPSPRPSSSGTVCTRRSSARSGRDRAEPGRGRADRAEDQRARH